MTNSIFFVCFVFGILGLFDGPLPCVEAFFGPTLPRFATRTSFLNKQDVKLGSKRLLSFEEGGALSSSVERNTEEMEDEELVSSLQRPKSNEPPIKDHKAMSKWNTDDEETLKANLQLASLAESCASHRNVTAAREAIRLLGSMQQPDSVAYNSVLKALAKISPAVLTNSGKTASQAAEMLLRQMQNINKRQLEANAAWYEELSNGTLTDAQLEQGPPRVRVKPNVRSFSTVMDALARAGDLESAQRAEELLYELQKLYETTQEWAMEPNLITYNTLLSAYASCGEARKCLRIIRDMPMAPDIISHNAVLHALARSSDEPNLAGPRAEEYLRTITNVRPNARSYSTCMDAWSQSGQPERAYRLLQEIVQVYRDSGRDPSLRPNAVTYSTVIHGYAVSKDPQKAVRAYQVWQDMIKEGVKPNQVTLNNVLNACATTRPSTAIVRRMIQTLYKHALEQGQPDEITFGIVLKACESFLDDPPVQPTEVFAEACRRGVVSPGVLHQLRQAVPSETFRKLVGDAGNWAELPPSWRTNVRRKALHGSRKRRFS